MFGYHLFGEARELTRFEKCEELKQLGAILAALRKKELELSKAKQGKGAGTVDFDKHTIVSKLLHDLDQLIAEFNAAAPHEQPDANVREIIQLASMMENTVKITLLRHKDTLKKFRNNQHAAVANTIDWGLFLGSMSALYMAPLGLLLKFGVYVYGMKPLQETILDYTGLTEAEARSMIILKGLKSTLHDIYANLRRTINAEYADDETLARLARGNDNIESGLLFVLSPSTAQYVDGFRGQKTNTDILAKMHLTDDEEELFKSHLCPVSLQVPDVIVRLEENDYFDLENLLKLKIDKDGARENPINRNKFYPRDIQPAREKNNEIKAIIEQIKERRLAAKPVEEPAVDAPRP